MSRLVLIHSLDPFGKAGLAVFEKALASAQLKANAIGTTPDFRSKEVDAAAETVAQSKPDAVLIYLAPARAPLQQPQIQSGERIHESIAGGRAKTQFWKHGRLPECEGRRGSPTEGGPRR